jgi:murein DD-endopeptidase MepM/ murein hydrolase activator NlpD
MGDFKVTQKFSVQHNGLDLIGISSKDIHSTVNGVVQYAGWENPNDKKQGFGMYVCIKSVDGNFYYFGHLSQVAVKTGDKIAVTDIIGAEGSTGFSTGSHLHYEIRPQFAKGEYHDVVKISGIKNECGIIQNDGYKPTAYVIRCPCCNTTFVKER